MLIPEAEVTPAQRARAAAEQGRTEVATMWALIAISNDLADIRRDLHWSLKQGTGRRG